MKTALSPQALCEKLEDQLAMKVDYLVPTNRLEMFPEFSEDTGLKGFSLAFETNDRNTILPIRNTAHSQIASRLQIPKKYYDRMRDESSELLIQNVNHWFENEPENRMIRSLGGEARAFLSDKYRPLDNWDLANAVLPILIQSGAEIVSCDITETKMYIKAINYQNTAEVEVGQPVAGGVIISNSEIGMGSLFVAPFIERLVCKNGMIVSDWAKRKYHVGTKNSDGLSFDKAYQLFTDKTKELTDQAFWSQVQDLVRASLNQDGLEEIVAPMRLGINREIANPIDQIEIVERNLGLDIEEKKGVLANLLKDDLGSTQWGLANAITRHAEDAKSYDRASELEAIGYEVATKSESGFNSLITK